MEPGQGRDPARGKLAGIDDQRALLALADMRAKLQRLPERHPDRGAMAALHRGGPEHDNVDAACKARRCCGADG